MSGAARETLIDLDILIESPEWRAAAPDIERIVSEAARAALATERLPASAISVLLTNDSAMRILNRQFRTVDAPTNVLSFPTPPTRGPKQFYGDIALGFETVASEARAQDKPLRNHVQHLIIHGVLHLLGFDHEADAQADVMEAVETRLLKTLGIPDPYSRRPKGE